MCSNIWRVFSSPLTGIHYHIFEVCASIFHTSSQFVYFLVFASSDKNSPSLRHSKMCHGLHTGKLVHFAQNFRGTFFLLRITFEIIKFLHALECSTVFSLFEIPAPARYWLKGFNRYKVPALHRNNDISMFRSNYKVVTICVFHYLSRNVLMLFAVF